MRADGALRAALVIGLSAALGACDGCDLGSDDTDDSGVPKWLRVEKVPEADEVRAAFEEARGRELSTRNCMEQPKALEGIVLIGEFAHDWGCEPAGVFIEGTYYGEQEATPAALDHLGWKEPNADRAELALRWLKEGWTRYRGYWQEKARGNFHSPAAGELHPPAARERDDGGVVVRVWIRSMGKARSLERTGFRIGPDAQLERRRLETFSPR